MNNDLKSEPRKCRGRPVGRSSSASTDAQMNAQIQSSRARPVAGLNPRSRIDPDNDDNTAFTEEGDILFVTGLTVAIPPTDLPRTLALFDAQITVPGFRQYRTNIYGKSGRPTHEEINEENSNCFYQSVSYFVYRRGNFRLGSRDRNTKKAQAAAESPPKPRASSIK